MIRSSLAGSLVRVLKNVHKGGQLGLLLNHPPEGRHNDHQKMPRMFGLLRQCLLIGFPKEEIPTR